MASQNVIKTASSNQLTHLLYSASLHYTQAIIISNPHVFELHGTDIKNQLPFPAIEFLLPAGETAKSLEQANRAWEFMANRQFDRKSVVIALGGGVVTDIAGFIAGCYMRGIDTIYIPTTLMGMVDAAIGGKTGVNLGQHKNFIGVFHSPRLIITDPSYLKTLSKREFSAGLAEVIKYGVIASPGLFDFLEQKIELICQREEVLLETIIQECHQIKHTIVQQDPFDRELRAILNYGHTFAHALEALTNYRHYLHGEAVAIGMSCAAYVSQEMHLIDSSVLERQDNLCLRANLPIAFPSLSNELFINLMRSDKKSISNKISLILLEKIGKVVKVLGVAEDLIKESLLKKQRHDERNRSFTFFHSYSPF